MVLSYFSKYTHRSTHVQSHKRWLDSKSMKELPDWSEAEEHDCLFGAVLRGPAHAVVQEGAYTIVSVARNQLCLVEGRQHSHVQDQNSVPSLVCALQL